MRGYFGIGMEGVSKAGNAGALARTAHAFGASFFFLVAPWFNTREFRLVDTSDAASNLPLYRFDTVAMVSLPSGCQVVGIELRDDAVDLPSFRHPLRAAYVVGPERSSLSPAMAERCDHLVRIPTRFCLNVGLAGALVMYDRMISLGRFAERPVRAGGPQEPLPPHVHGRPVFTHPPPWAQPPSPSANDHGRTDSDP